MGNTDLTSLFLVTFFSTFCSVHVCVWLDELTTKLKRKKERNE